MKLLHVIAGMDPKMGGVCQAVRTMIAGLAELDVQNEVVCLDSSDALFLSNDLFPVHALGPARGPWQYSEKLTPWLIENLCGFDAVVVHGLWLYHGYSVQKVIRNLKSQESSCKQATKSYPKFFVMPHGMLDPYFQRASNRKLKSIRNWLYWKLLEHKVVKTADALLFTCKAELELARIPFRPYKPQQEINVGLGIVEPPSFIPEMQQEFLALCPALKDHAYFLFLSRIHEKKGVDILIRSYSAVVKRITEKNAGSKSQGHIPYSFPKLVIAGPGIETPYGQKLQHLVMNDPQLCNEVFFPGMLAGNTKWGAFYGCDAFVLPSHQENFGIAVVEALACGKPVMISDKINIWQEIKATGGGMIADDSEKGTTEMITGWVKMPYKSRVEMGQNARLAFEKHFALRPVAKRFFNNIFAAMHAGPITAYHHEVILEEQIALLQNQ